MPSRLPIAMPWEQFAGTRAWIQRLTDSKVFAGWIEEIDRGQALVVLSQTGDLASGEPCIMQAFGQGNTATFKVHVQVVSDGQASFALEGPPKLAASNEDARIRVGGLDVLLEDDYAPIEGKVVDVSSRGLGVAVTLPMQKGTAVRVKIACASGEILGEGEIRYCRQVSEVPQEFRVGIKLQPLDRLNQARWNQLMGGKQAA